MSKNLLINENPLMVLPSLVKRLGTMERAVVLQQIHFLSTMPKSGKNIDGHHWVWGSYQEWCDTWFTFWSTRQLQRHILWLEQNNYLISEKFKSGDWNHTKYYRIDYDRLGMSDSDTPVTPDGDTSVAIEDDTSVAIIYTETTTETSAKNTTEKDGRSVFLLWEQNMPGLMTPILAEQIGEAIEEFGEEAMIHGINVAVENGVRKLAYVKGVARRHSSGEGAPTSKEDTYSAVEFESREGWTAPDLEPTVFSHMREAATWKCEWDVAEKFVRIITGFDPVLAEMRLGRNITTALQADPQYRDWTYDFAT